MVYSPLSPGRQESIPPFSMYGQGHTSSRGRRRHGRTRGAATLRACRHRGPGCYEQASRFARIGAGIQMMPNSMKVLRQIGDRGARCARRALPPYSHLNRAGTTGEITRELPMPESLYNAPYLCMHRADLHDALASAVPGEIVNPRQEAGWSRSRSRTSHAAF